MAAVTAAIGLGLAAVGTGISVFSSYQQNEANQQAIAAQQQAEAIRRRAMEVDAERRRRQYIRESMIARATGLSNATNRGAGQSSAVPGIYGQIGGRTAFGITGLNDALATGAGLFGANMDLFQARSNASSAEALGGLGRGLTSLGGGIVSNYGAMDRIFGGTSYTPNYGQAVNSGILGVAPWDAGNRDYTGA